MLSQIQIIEKPDWVSWEEIKQCLGKAHSVNQKNGFNMVKCQWPIEKIRESIGKNGVMLVALDGKKVVGTAAIGEKYGTKWYTKGRYAYMSLASVLPEYNGCGIYKNLIRQREEIAKTHGYSVFLLDTHEMNKKIRNISESNGYYLVSLFRVYDHYNVMMAKWPAGCPYSKFYCQFRFYLSWVDAHLRTWLYKPYCIVKKIMRRN